MKCQCRAAQLKQALTHTTGVTTKRASLSILAHVRIEVSNGLLTVQATDLSVAIEARVPATQTSIGVCAVDGQLLARVLESASPRAIATISHAEGTLTVTLPHGVTNIRTVSHEEFPPLPAIETPVWSLQLGISEFVSGLKSVLYAASPSEVKPEISAVYLHKQKESLVLVSTDSFRLAEKTINIAEALKTKEEGMLIPARSCAHIVRVCEGDPEEICQYDADETKVRIQTKLITITSRLVSGRYPNYQQIIPTEANTNALVLQNDVVQALRATSLFTDRFSQIDMSVSSEEQQITFSAKNPDVGETVYTTKAQVTGESLDVRCNARFVKDALQSMQTDGLQFEFTEPKRPFLMKPVGDKSFQYLVMPLNRT